MSGESCRGFIGCRHVRERAPDPFKKRAGLEKLLPLWILLWMMDFLSLWLRILTRFPRGIFLVILEYTIFESLFDCKAFDTFAIVTGT